MPAARWNCKSTQRTQQGGCTLLHVCFQHAIETDTAVTAKKGQCTCGGTVQGAAKPKEAAAAVLVAAAPHGGGYDVRASAPESAARRAEAQQLPPARVLVGCAKGMRLINSTLTPLLMSCSLTAGAWHSMPAAWSHSAVIPVDAVHSPHGTHVLNTGLLKHTWGCQTCPYLQARSVHVAREPWPLK